MNDIDRQSLANCAAAILFLLLVYGLAGLLDDGSEHRLEQAPTMPTPALLLCEPADEAPPPEGVATGVLLVMHKSQPPRQLVLRCESVDR